MSIFPSSRPTLTVAREHIAMLFEVFARATGAPQTAVARLARGDPKFGRIFETTDFGFKSYDVVNSRLSALWPAGVPWPESVPRQEPADVEPEAIAEVKARVAGEKSVIYRPAVRSGPGRAPKATVGLPGQ